MPTLYISGQDVVARLEDRRAVLKRLNQAGEDVATVPLFNVERVVFIGYPKLSMQLLHHFIYQNIPVFFLTTHGRWISSMLPRTQGSALRRLAQYEAARNDDMILMAARQLIHAKIRNMRRVLQRLAANRDQSDAPEQTEICDALRLYAHQVLTAPTPASIRGLEGIATACYFRRLRTFFPPELPFVSRNRRPPRDAANALLSWTYSVVQAEIDAEIACASLDPCIGFLHNVSYGRPSLALDLLEPLRAPLGDLLALNLLNHNIMRPEHFEKNEETGGVYLKDDSRKIFFAEYEQYMERPFAECKNGRRVTFRRVIRNMVNAVSDMITSQTEPQFFQMP